MPRSTDIGVIDRLCEQFRTDQQLAEHEMNAELFVDWCLEQLEREIQNEDQLVELESAVRLVYRRRPLKAPSRTRGRSPTARR
jgi:hypothetical protein